MTGWNMPCGCNSVPGDDLPRCCEECPDDVYAECPGQDDCYVVQEYKIVMRGCEVP